MAKVQGSEVKVYPDISELPQAKERRRQKAAQMPIEEKLAWAEKLRDAVRLIKRSKPVTGK